MNNETVASIMPDYFLPDLTYSVKNGGKVILKLSLLKPWWHMEGVDALIHSFLTLAVDGGEY